jgi:hypothetical protein
MKVFVRTDSLGTQKPTIIAVYPDDSNIPANAHGEGMTILHVPMQAIEKVPPVNSPEGGRLPVLSDNWREAAGDMPVKAEAKRRIEEAFPASDQLNSLYEMVDTVVQYGIDITKWPADARQRKVEFDKKWKYVAEVREQLKTHSAAMPRDPSSDKIWPRRLARS